MSAPIIPTWIVQAKQILITGLGKVLPNLNQNTSPEVFSGVVASMLDYLTFSDVLLLREYLQKNVGLFNTTSIPAEYPAVSNRISGMENLLSTVLDFNASILDSEVNFANILNGQSIWPTTVQNLLPSLLSWYGETPVDSAIPASVQETAAEFQDFATQPGFSAPQQDVINHMALIAGYQVNYAQYLSINPNNPFPSYQGLWSQVIALPAYFMGCQYSYANFMEAYRQQYDVIRMIGILFAVSNAAIYSTQSTLANSTVSLATLRQGETLQSFAQRTTGSFENWIEIAEINNLLPPYINTGTTPIPNTVTYGQNLYLPPGPSSVPTSYTKTILGTDLNFGQPFGDAPNWTGDLSTVSGLDNYVLALLRRVFTPLRTYPYNAEYGSRLPLEVGKTTSPAESARLGSYLRTTLLSDPRTAAVPSVSASFSQQYQALTATAEVVPIGQNTPQTLTVKVQTNV